MKLYSRLKTFFRNLFPTHHNDLSVEVYCYPPPIENQPLTLEEYMCQVEQFGVFREDIAIYYLALGLCSEIGEAYSADYSKALKKELGDVCWYMAMLAIRGNIILNVPPQSELRNTTVYDGWGTLIKHGLLVADVKKILRGDMTLEQFLPTLDTSLNYVLLSVMTIANINNWTLEEILGDNIYKLTLRQQNGTIKGSGDDR